MRYKLTKPYQRIFDLLNILLDAHGPLSKFEVAEQIGCSRPTLDSTIIDANHLIKQFSQIEFNNEGLFLAGSGYLNKRQVRSIISNETFIVQFLTDLLLGKFNKIEEWSEAKFHSSSVIYRKLKNLEFFLERMGIQLNNDESGVYLKGDSWRIRYLYFQIFKEKAIVDDVWPFETLSYPVLLEFVQSVCDELEVQVSPIVEYFYTLITALHLIIGKSSHVKDTVNKEKYLLLLKSHTFDDAIAIIEKHINRKLTEEDKAMLISSIELFPVTYKTVEAMHRRVVHSSLSDHIMYTLSFQVYQIFNPGEEEISKFVHYLDIFTSLEMLNDFQVINFDGLQSQPFKLEKNRQTDDFLERVKEIEEKIKNSPCYATYEINRLLIQQRLYILYQTYTFSPNRDPLTVTVLSQDGRLKENYYKHQLINHFSSERIRTVDCLTVHQKNMWQEIDLVLTDYTLSERFDINEIYYLDNDITKNDLKKIDVILTKLKNQQEFID